MTRSRFLLCLILGWGLCGSVGAASLDESATISDSIKSSPNPTANQAEIDTVVKAQVNNLLSGSPTTQSSARQALVAGAQGRGANAPSPAYLSIYSSSLNSALLPVLKDPKANIRARLNAAIVIADVGSKANNGNLVPAATQLINDPSGALVLQGLKACADGTGLTQAVLKNPGLINNNKLLPAIPQTVKNHVDPPFAGQIAAAAYRALSPPPGLTAPELRVLVGYMIDLQKTRIQQYATMKTIPANPETDALGALLLLDPHAWQAMTPQQQEDAKQISWDLISVAGQWAEQPNVQLEGLKRLVFEEANLLNAFAQQVLENDQTLAAAVQPLTSFRGNPHDLSQACLAARGGIEKDANFSTLKESPTIAGGAATAPAPAALTGGTR